MFEKLLANGLVATNVWDADKAKFTTFIRFQVIQDICVFLYLWWVAFSTMYLLLLILKQDRSDVSLQDVVLLVFT